MRAPRRPGKHVVQPPNGFVSAGEAFAQLSLLTLQLGGQRCVVLLQLAQASDIRPICRSDEMREHVHLAEHVLDHGVGRRRMGEQSPIGAGNIAAPERFLPKRRHGGRVLCF
jgi:hypothetical protein